MAQVTESHVPQKPDTASQAPVVGKANYVLYDDGCPFCTFQMRILTWLDWFNTVTLLPISDPRAKEIAPTISREDLLEAIHCVAKDGKIYRGARCLRFVGLRTPLGVPLALFLWLPGVIWVAEKVYAWVAARRYLFSRMFGCKDACSIMPARKRSNGDSVPYNETAGKEDKSK